MIRSFLKIIAFPFVFFIIVLLNLNGQESISFHNMSEGLSQNTVTNIAQDNQGFIWVATHYGLDRYNGHSYNYIDIERDDGNAPSSNLITPVL